ncbi:MAG TPA: methyltransferase domain-containing protein [Candidatus Omnitrophota bacterium]|nr:methyltransferase domain-containing protein [Candidatus Omnitrophota bacterium]HPD84133.1 methyltransferase domain-containing protein [Candidatus Omnitrophota bacterium]HRZ02990.1 methyltransferase domain-containing protein [Candidatus Omnitrophota bacterium]
MKSNVLKKRTEKFRGFLNLLYSGAFLRFTRLNRNRLLRQTRTLGIDRLHIGCGNILLEGWLNITYEMREKYGEIKERNGRWWLNYDVRKQLPFDDNTIQYIAGSHFIEHLDLNEGMDFFKEAFRVMKKGGVIRVSCPDLEIYARHYVSGNKEFFENPFIRQACTFKNAVTNGEIFAAKAYDSGGAHKWFYDFNSLKHVLELAGFHQVKKVGRLQGQVPDVQRIEPAEREIETSYAEAVKP